MLVRPIFIYNKSFFQKADEQKQSQYLSQISGNSSVKYSGTRFLSYYVPTNFKSSKSCEDLSAELKNLDNMHCPACGIKLLNASEIKKLMREADKARSPKEFILFLKKYDDSIPQKYKKLFESAQRNENLTSVRSVADLIEIMRGSAIISLDNSIDKAIGFIEDYRNKNLFSDSDNVLLDECEIRLKDFDTENNDKLLPSVLRSVQETIGNLEYLDKNKIKQDIFNEIFPNLLYHHMFPIRSEYKDDKKYQQKFVQRIFGSSFSTIQKITPSFESEEIPANRILTCKECSVSSPYQYITENMSKENFEENFSKYIEEISKNVLEGNIKTERKYPLMLKGFVFKLSNGHINLDKIKYPAIREIQKQIFEENQKAIDFDPVNHSGVPCSSCKTITITHEEKLDLLEQVKETNTNQQLVDLLKKNEQHLIGRDKQVMKEIEKQLIENPNITEEEIVEKLRKVSAEEIKKEIKGNIAVCNIMSTGLPLRDRKYIEEFVTELQDKYLDFSYDSLFPYQEYMELVRDTLYKVKEDNIRKHYSNKFKEAVRTAYNKQTLFFPSSDLIDKVGSSLKVVVQNIFKDSVATIDHFVAKNKKGEDDLANLTVMCKACNREKTNYSLQRWLCINPKWPQNLQNYVNELARMIRVGTLDTSYEKYLQDLVENANKLTNGRIHLHYTPKDPIKKHKK